MDGYASLIKADVRMKWWRDGTYLMVVDPGTAGEAVLYRQFIQLGFKYRIWLFKVKEAVNFVIFLHLCTQNSKNILKISKYENVYY